MSYIAMPTVLASKHIGHAAHHGAGETALVL
jgi:hypothetical protein